MDEMTKDITRLTHRLRTETRVGADLVALERYICHTVCEVLVRLFERPYSSQPVVMDVKQHHKRFASILHSLSELQNGCLTSNRHSKNWYRVADCNKRLAKCAETLGLFPVMAHLPPSASLSIGGTTSAK